MDTVTLIDRDGNRFAEMTCEALELEITTGALGQEGRSERRQFSQQDAMKSFVEEWLEERAREGFAVLAERESLPPIAPARLPYEAIQARLRTTPGPSADDDADVDDGYDEDLLDHMDGGDWDECLDDGLDEELNGPEQDYAERPMTALSVDEAFEERVKEQPFDLDVAVEASNAAGSDTSDQQDDDGLFVREPGPIHDSDLLSGDLVHETKMLNK